MSLKTKYFVLNPRSKIHQDPYAKAARVAMEAYAHSIKQVDSKLCASLYEWTALEQYKDIKKGGDIKKGEVLYG